MKRVLESIKNLAAVVCAAVLLFSCEESKRFEIGYSDSEPPLPPVFVKYKPTYGGVRIFFKAPENKDLLSIDAVYRTKKGEERWFSVSYYADHIDVAGFATQEPHIVELYAVDRAGNQSERLNIEVEPLQPAVEQVANTVYCVGGFSSFYINWENGLMQSMKIFLEYEYSDASNVKHEKSIVYTSREAEERQFIRDPGFSDKYPVSVKIRVEDEYGNTSSTFDMGQLRLLADEVIPKDKWQIPATNDSTIVNRAGERVNTGVPMGFFDGYEGRAYMMIDDIINDGTFVNFVHTRGYGRTGESRDGNTPWNYIIDLGDYYELSRIITHQRYRSSGANEYSGREDYYRNENVGKYSMWRWDEDTQAWDSITTNIITFPLNLPDRQYKILGQQGDMAYMHPDDPKFTKPTRWFRYEALASFDDQYTGINHRCVSELTLYGRKAEGY
ncbi:MAG: DUF4959 domain-containing protein [Bacteroidales bacterium]|jgi:hypothetical protein|nr:DUF4959 domain-containing protein [Bacteroidales bacterium]